MIAKKKKCDGCQKETVIWKSEGRKKYCKQCWSCHSGEVRQTSKRTPLRPRSSKQQKLEAAYKVLRETFLDAHPMCQAHLSGCTLKATDIHHKAGRGEYLLDQSTYLAVCRTCHTYIETHPEESKELSFSVERLKKKEK